MHMYVYDIYKTREEPIICAPLPKHSDLGDIKLQSIDIRSLILSLRMKSGFGGGNRVEDCGDTMMSDGRMVHSYAPYGGYKKKFYPKQYGRGGGFGGGGFGGGGGGYGDKKPFYKKYDGGSPGQQGGGGGGNYNGGSYGGGNANYSAKWSYAGQNRAGGAVPKKRVGLNKSESEGSQDSDLPKIYQSLSNNAVRKLVTMGAPEMKEKVDEELIVQVIMVKYMQGSANKNMKARLMFSDGTWAVMAIMSQDIHEKMNSKEIKQNDIIKISSSSCVTKPLSADQNQIVLVMRDSVEVVYRNLASKLGNPKEFKTDTPKDDESEQNLQVQFKIPNSVIKGNLNLQDHELSYVLGGVIPISKLTPFMQSKWRIKARIVKKSERRCWKNDRGEGYLVNVELIDEEGTKIQGTFFKDMVDKFDEILAENNVYLFTGGIIKESPAKFATVKHEYCIVFEKTSQIEQIDDDGSVAGQVNDSPNCFNFCTIQSLEEMTANEYLDVLAVVQKVGPIGLVTIKNGESRKRRNLIICDETNTSICLCIWGDKVNMNLKENPVIAIKGARVSDYFKRSLNAFEDSRIYVNPNFERAKDIKLWYECLMDEAGQGATQPLLEFRPLSEKVDELVTVAPSNASEKQGFQQKANKKPVAKKKQTVLNPEELKPKQQPPEGEGEEGDFNMEEQEPDEACDGEDQDGESKNLVGVDPEQIKMKLLDERRKSFAKTWYSKYNYYQKQHGGKQDAPIGNKARLTSGIGEERIKQMKAQANQAEKKKGAKKQGAGEQQEEQPKQGRGKKKTGAGTADPFGDFEAAPQQGNFFD